MRGLRSLVFFSAFLAIRPALLGQYYFYNDHYLEPRIRLEAGGQAGVMNALTDLGGTRGPAKGFLQDLNPEATHFSYGFFVQAYFSKGLSLRVQWANGRVSGADSLAPETDTYSRLRHERNLHFRSRIRETAILLQIDPLQLWGGSLKKFQISPYLLAGVGRFHFNPEARLGLQWITLAPLATEGQLLRDRRTAYPLTQWNFLFGGGVSLDVSARSTLHIEFLYRKLFTDYLDDVSTHYLTGQGADTRTGNEWRDVLGDRRQSRNSANIADAGSTKRGNPRANDSFFSLMMHWGWILNRRNR